jgi:hypothetical protein
LLVVAAVGASSTIVATRVAVRSRLLASLRSE